MIYLCVPEQLNISDELVSLGVTVRAYTNKSFNKWHNAIIIYLLLHFKHILSAIKSYYGQEKTILTRCYSECYFLSLPLGHIATTQDRSQNKQ